METRETIETRRAVHGYADRDVTDDELLAVFETVKHAPSGWNLQPWEFVVVRDDDERRALRSLTYRDQEHITDAPVVVVLFGRLDPSAHAEEALDDYVEKGYIDRDEADELLDDIVERKERPVEANKKWTIRNCMVAGTTLLYAAWDAGIATCPVTGWDSDAVAEFFDAPDDVYPVLMVTVGYPDDVPPDKYRRPPEEFVHFGGFE